MDMNVRYIIISIHLAIGRTFQYSISTISFQNPLIQSMEGKPYYSLINRTNQIRVVIVLTLFDGVKCIYKMCTVFSPYFSHTPGQNSEC